MNITDTADTVFGNVSVTVMETAVICPPNGPDAILSLSRSRVDDTETRTPPPVLLPDAMLEKTQVFSAVVHALVRLSTNFVAEPPRAATVAVGAVSPPVHATAGSPAPAATKNPDGKLMVMALLIPAPLTKGNANVVNLTVTALPPAAAAAAAVPGT